MSVALCALAVWQTLRFRNEVLFMQGGRTADGTSGSPNGSSHRAFTQKLFRVQPEGFLVAAARARTKVSTRRKPPISFVTCPV